MPLTEAELERLFIERKTPEAGRRLIRELRQNGPVRNLQWRMDAVRTRYISRKMGRALYAESRTVELPAIVLREKDKATIELWPQPCQLDLSVGGKRGSTRVQHTPDLFLITETAFVMEEWREESRLLMLSTDRPEHFYKDDSGTWHYVLAERHLSELGIEYYLRSADEHPRKLLANISFLEDYSLETTPAVPESEARRATKLLADRRYITHLELVHEHKFSADHIFQMVLDERLYVDLENAVLSRTDELIIYQDRTVGQADALMRRGTLVELPSNAYALRVGSRFLYDETPYEVILLGRQDVIVRDAHGATKELPLSLVSELFQRAMLEPSDKQKVEKEYDPSVVLVKANRLREAMERLQAIRSPADSKYGDRSLRRFRAAVRGLTSQQDQLQALMSENKGNRTPRLPAQVLRLADAALRLHNVAAKPTVFSTYNQFVVMCEEVGVAPMCRSSFYNWVATREDIAAREGKRKKYQKSPIPLTYDCEQPVHGVLPHEVAYCDHTVLNVFLKGSRLPDLGKPTLTLMLDGGMTMARAFFLSYRPAGTVSVLMCLRDYVRRHGRLPKVLVLDNGREFHSEALKVFCSMFNIQIRWRRRSRPRDSTMVERMLGATEMEVLSSLDGNSLAMKDPRMVSPSHHPDKNIRWTLPALHGSLQHFLFEVHPNRIHSRLRMSPREFERRQLLELGAREHVLVRYDNTFKLMTAPHSGQATRAIDRIRGVFVDGQYYWNERLAQAKKGENVEVRVELWNARVVYANFRGDWLVAQARDGGRLDGRFRDEFEFQKREEARRGRTAALKDRQSPEQARKKVGLWTPEAWDPRLREQRTEEYLIYDRLGMVEVLPEAKNASGAKVELGMPQGSDLPLLKAIRGEPDVLPSSVEETETAGALSASTSTSDETNHELTVVDDDYF